MTSDKEKFGLSEENRNYIVCLILVTLLIFGPVEPYGLVVRIAYLISIPVLFWFVFYKYGDHLRISEKTNLQLTRAIFLCIAGALLIGAYFSLTAKYHDECTKYIHTRDGQECVGEYVTIEGSDKSSAYIMITFAALAIYFAVTRKQRI